MEAKQRCLILSCLRMMNPFLRAYSNYFYLSASGHHGGSNPNGLLSKSHRSKRVTLKRFTAQSQSITCYLILDNSLSSLIYKSAFFLKIKKNIKAADQTNSKTSQYFETEAWLIRLLFWNGRKWNGLSYSKITVNTFENHWIYYKLPKTAHRHHCEQLSIRKWKKNSFNLFVLRIENFWIQIGNAQLKINNSLDIFFFSM